MAIAFTVLSKTGNQFQDKQLLFSKHIPKLRQGGNSPHLFPDANVCIFLLQTAAIVRGGLT